jgi:hypothetical protein
MDIVEAITFSFKPAHRRAWLITPTVLMWVTVLSVITLIGPLLMLAFIMGYYWWLMHHWHQSGLDATAPPLKGHYKTVALAGLKASSLILMLQAVVVVILIAGILLILVSLGFPMGQCGADAKAAVANFKESGYPELLELLVNGMSFLMAPVIAMAQIQGAQKLSFAETLKVNQYFKKGGWKVYGFMLLASFLAYIISLALGLAYGLSCLLIIPILFLPTFFAWLLAFSMHLQAQASGRFAKRLLQA